MGLDQYLTASRYVSGWNHSDEEEQERYRSTLDKLGLTGWRCEGSPHATVQVCVAYWRKANQVHQWFVQNVQEGNDNCQGHYVSREQLAELRDLCKKVLASSKLVAGTVTNGYSSSGGGDWKANLEQGEIVENSTEARELLPTSEGCFFGSQDYDQYYWHDLEDTVAQLNAVLEDDRFKGFEFEYRASW